MTRIARHILVQGVVQGVGFRPFIYRIAVQRELVGSVRNLGDAGVEIHIEGSPSAVAAFLRALEVETPPLARIDQLQVEGEEPTKADAFRILSSSDEGEGGGQLPPDVAICDTCVEEILGESRFQGYWATSCTDCGPRFTVIESLPYDRPRTSMIDFPMCDTCASEYGNPLERRYHAQTTACAACGPVLRFDGDERDAIAQAVEALKVGCILAIKGIGGTHLACDAGNAQAIETLRRRLGRPAQPFALMAHERMLDAFVQISDSERDGLRSSNRPIVVLHQKASALPESVAPGLHTVGVMLPYTGLHHLLFDRLEFPLVMTSANRPGEPMLIENARITTELGSVVDHTLLHDRRIVARCDDSVQRTVASDFVFLRRSRGWVPQGLPYDLGEKPILALGPESDLTFALYDRKQVTLSQHIGNVDDLQTLDYLNEAIDHLRRIAPGRPPAVIACDLHPHFMTTALAHEMAEQHGAAVVSVQHHAAHLLSVMVEHELDEAVGIILDGYGYGSDGSAWGGEILVARERCITRPASLRPIPLPGGDLAAHQPMRLVASALLEGGWSSDNVCRILGERDFTEEEVGLLLAQIERRVNTPMTTSAGRFLDAVSAWLRVGETRTYEGEPAMRLEAAAASGKVHPLPVAVIQREEMEILDTTALLRTLVELSASIPAGDVAATAQQALAEGAVEMALRAAERTGIRSVVLSGGVTYNEHISRVIHDRCLQRNAQLFLNRTVPCGDGGVSLGQAAYAGLGYRMSAA